MKVKVVHRDPFEYDPAMAARGSAGRVFKNADPQLHPMERAREIQRAITAAKMEKMFAKPLVGVLDGHRDSIRSMARSHTEMADCFTGSFDGEVRIWNLSSMECKRSIRAHTGCVRGLVASFDDTRLYSCSDDGKIKAWLIEKNFDISNYEEEAAAEVGQLVSKYEGDVSNLAEDVRPVQTYTSNGPLSGIDHHWSESIFVTSSDTIDVWDSSRSAPIHCFEWGADAFYTAKINPAEGSLIGATAANRCVALFDIRSQGAVQKAQLVSRSNCFCWNPYQPMNFTVGNDDHNLYTYDLRKLERCLAFHKDFTNAVLDVDYSPTGREFVAGSHDGTIRIFKTDGGRSREVYHTKRMHLVMCCRYTPDSRFVMSGSGDMCVRIWKATACEPLGPRNTREKKAMAYREALRKRYAHVPEVGRILRHRHVPALIKRTGDKKRVMEEAQARKDMNVALNSKPGTVKAVAEREKPTKKLLE